MEKIIFKGYNLYLKTMRSDKSFRVEIDVGLDEYDNIKELPKLPEGIYEITLKPEVEENHKEK
jgi:hypothetical protein